MTLKMLFNLVIQLSVKIYSVLHILTLVHGVWFWYNVEIIKLGVNMYGVKYKNVTQEVFM